jgi:hypothetical protein
MRFLWRAHRLWSPGDGSVDAPDAGGTRSRTEPLERHGAPHLAEHRSIPQAGGDPLDVRRR